jgi:energy-coupling factor transport system permease protein
MGAGETRQMTGQPARTARAFSTCHASVPLACFAGVIVISMFAIQPVYVAISLAGALAFSLLARGLSPTLRGLRWQLPMIALICLLNPLFSASGSTLVLKLGPLSVYAESLAYGAVMGALMVAVVVWFEDAAAVLTQDRLLSLSPRRARSVPVVVSIAAQLVPQLLERSRTVRSTSDACTAAGPRPSGKDALINTSTLLLDWSLEDSLERSDAMRARGWESGRERTCYRVERFGSSDAFKLTLLVLLVCVNALLAWVACSQWHFYPTMPQLVMWWGYLPFAALAFVPMASELLARATERRLS